MKHVYPIVFVCLVAPPVAAQSEWSKGIARGLEAYALQQGEGVATLICDPDRIFGNNVTNAGLRVVFPKDVTPSRMVVLASSGEQASFVVTDGGANETEADAEEWAKMVAIVQKGGDFAFVTGQDALQFEDVTPLPDLEC